MYLMVGVCVRTYTITHPSRAAHVAGPCRHLEGDSRAGVISEGPGAGCLIHHSLGEDFPYACGKGTDVRRITVANTTIKSIGTNVT